ncbi:MAG: hypothetical protein AB1566_14875, partial [Chloroflexota bacterium]
MPRLIVQRKRSLVGALRTFQVTVDGRDVATVKSGQQVALDLAVGAHELSVQVDWVRSNRVPFALQEGEERFFLCGPGLFAPRVESTHGAAVEAIRASGGLDLTLQLNWQTLVVCLLLLATLAIAGARGYAYLQLTRIHTVDHLAFDGERVCVHHGGVLHVLTPGGWLRDSIPLAELGLVGPPADLEFAGNGRLLVGD